LIAGRLQAVRDRIATACARVSRDPASVRLIGVSKSRPAADVRAAFAAGLVDFGENRVQEAETKAAELGDLRAAGLRWHLIGHLQANKAKSTATLSPPGSRAPRRRTAASCRCWCRSTSRARRRSSAWPRST
jgi:uncharacterized pyridoxal phosphate-containing UPF0001 family protein